MTRRGLAALALSLAGPAALAETRIPAPAQVAAPGDVAVTADGRSGTREVTAAALAKLRVETLTLAGRHGPQVFQGPTLWSVLAQTGLVSPDMRTRSHSTVSVIGSDGYAAVLALGELDPAFEGKQVLLATRRDGAALARPHLAVPGDRAMSRDVHDVVGIVIR